MSYNGVMRAHRLKVSLGSCLLACVLALGCSSSREVEKDLKLVDVSTGWYDMGLVNGQNKLVPSVTLQLQNVSE